MHQRKVDVDMLNAVKSVLADVSSVSPSSDEQVAQKITLNMLAYYSPVFEKEHFYHIEFVLKMVIVIVQA